MDKYSKMMSAYVKIWPVASGINAVISSLILMPSLPGEIFALFFLIFIFSIILSIPILLVAMLSSAIVLSLQKVENIFGIVLVVTLFSSVAGVIFFNGLLSIISDGPISLGASIVVSAVGATVFIFSREKVTEEVTIEERNLE